MANIFDGLFGPPKRVGQSKWSDKFPRKDWESQREIYQAHWDYFTGKAWFEKSQAGGERFPLRINPFRTFAQKHAYTLFGEVPDRAATLVHSKFLPKSKDDSGREISQEAEDAIEVVLGENHTRATFMEAGVMSQFLGMAVFKVGWGIPTQLAPSGVKVERVIPDFFIGVPDGADMYILREAWIAYPITPEEALNTYGVSSAAVGAPSSLLLIEYWNKSEYEVSIDGQIASIALPNGERFSLAGKNQFGFVPIIAIPHERAGEFQGLGHVDNLEHLAREYNARMGDRGDAARRTATGKIPVFNNMIGGIRHVEVAPGLKGINMGQSAPGADPPEASVMDVSSNGEEMGDYADELYKQLRRDGYLPAVADGEDEGSQRSALTLSFRMWPLTSHIRSERNCWTPGLNLLSEMILIVLSMKNPMIEDANIERPESVSKIGKQHLGHQKFQQWYPMVPRDREQQVNELILRAGVRHISPQTALREYGDIDDVEAEYQLILDALRDAAEMQSQMSGGAGKGDVQGLPTGDVAAPAKSAVVAPAAASFAE